MTFIRKFKLFQVTPLLLVLTVLVTLYYKCNSILKVVIENKYSSSLKGEEELPYNVLRYPYPYEASFEAIQGFYELVNPDACAATVMWGGVLVPFDTPQYDISENTSQSKSVMDGNKTICMDESVKPVPGNCIVYSFGINNEWSFDTDAANYGCKVFAFDPTMDSGDHVRGPNNSIYFYQMGLSNKNETIEGRPYRTFATIVDLLGHNNRHIDIVKIDIEGGEGDSLLQMLKSGATRNIRQLIVEIHNFSEDEMTIKHYYSTFWYLELRGFVRYFSAPNLLTHTHWHKDEKFEYFKCRELGWINSKFLDSEE